MSDFGTINECMIADCPHNDNGGCLFSVDITLDGLCGEYAHWARTGEWPEREPLPILKCDWCNHQEFGPNLPERRRCPKMVSWWDKELGKTLKHPCGGTMVRQEKE